MAAAALQTLPAGSFQDHTFNEGSKIYWFRVHNGHVLTREAVLNPNHGDIWFGQPEPGDAHNIWVYGTLTGTDRTVYKRTLVSEWTRVPQDTDWADVERRFHFPTNVQLKGSRFLQWKPISLEGFRWITRSTASSELGEQSL